MAKIRDHAGPSDPFSTLVRAGADPDHLCLLCQCVRAGARVKQYPAKEAKRVARLRRAKQLRWRRFPGRLCEIARELDKYISDPAFDPRRLLPKSEAKLTLGQRIELRPLHTDLGALVTRLVGLPRTLREFAVYVDLCLRNGMAKQSVDTKVGEALDRSKVLLCDYVRESTGRPHFQRAADLVNELLAKFGARLVTADDLCKLCTRNSRLRKSPKPFQF